MFSFSVSLILSLLVWTVGSNEFRKSCRQALQRGRYVIENSVPALVHEETSRYRRRVAERMKEMQTAEVLHPQSLIFPAKYLSLKAVGDDGQAATLPPCPEPNRTMFTTLAPITVPALQTTTTGVTSCSSTVILSTTVAGTSSGAQTAMTSSSGAAASSAGTTLPSVGTSAAAQTSTTSRTGGTGTAQSTIASNPANPTTRTISTQTVPVPGDDSNTQTSTSGDVSTVASMSSAGSSSASSSSPYTTFSPEAPSSSAGTTMGASGCVGQDEGKESKRSFVMPTMYSSVPESDPFHNWMSSIYDYMFKEEEICDQPPLKDLNSITEDQLYGFLATLSAANPGPFCSLCDRFMSEVRKRVFVANPLWGEDGEHIMRLLYANIPTSKAFCSTLAPACYENYAARTRNITEATICLECTACMTVGNVIQHNFLLDKGVVDAFLRFLRSSFFHNTCAELCLVWQPLNLTLFPNGFTYEGCMDFMDDRYADVINIATVLLRPERFCSLVVVIVGSKRYEPRCSCVRDCARSDTVKRSCYDRGGPLLPSFVAAVCDDPTLILIATLHRAASSATACVTAPCRFGSAVTSTGQGTGRWVGVVYR
ncbi:hypothetical protein RB195_004786 [Necator americanus]|uniref:Saposin B-type domain-containing protein n=1 Tax=Necator americanus TaxID=51031 RepID=A0ABR1BNL6_NECAM